MLLLFKIIYCNSCFAWLQLCSNELALEKNMTLINRSSYYYLIIVIITNSSINYSSFIQDADYYEYPDYYYQQDAQAEGTSYQKPAASSGAAPTQQQYSPSNFHSVSYPPQASDSPHRREQSR